MTRTWKREGLDNNMNQYLQAQGNEDASGEQQPAGTGSQLSEFKGVLKIELQTTAQDLKELKGNFKTEGRLIKFESTIAQIQSEVAVTGQKTSAIEHKVDKVVSTLFKSPISSSKSFESFDKLEQVVERLDNDQRKKQYKNKRFK